MSYLRPSPYYKDYKITTNYYQTDSMAMFERNKSILGPHWRFYNLPIEYKMNSIGYRMKELEDIDYSNYIAFFGCSYTVGVGLPLEETFAYKIAHMMGLGDNYINAAVGGSSTSWAMLNILRLIGTAPAKPKIIIVNWTYIQRMHYWLRNDLTFMQPNGTLIKPDISKYWKEVYETTILEVSHINNTFDYIKETVVTLCRLAGIKLIQLSSIAWPADFFNRHPDIIRVPIRPEVLPVNRIDIHNLIRARDIVSDISMSIQDDTGTFTAHPGIYHQDRVVEAFTKEIQL
jgi:hypothetical protein